MSLVLRWSKFALWLATFPAGACCAYGLKRTVDRVYTSRLIALSPSAGADMEKHNTNCSAAEKTAHVSPVLAPTTPSDAWSRPSALMLWSASVLPLNIAMCLAMHYYHCLGIYNTVPSVFTLQVAAHVGFELFWQVWPIVSTLNFLLDTTMKPSSNDPTHLRMSLHDAFFIPLCVAAWTVCENPRLMKDEATPLWFCAGLVLFALQSVVWFVFFLLSSARP